MLIGSKFAFAVIEQIYIFVWRRKFMEQEMSEKKKNIRNVNLTVNFSLLSSDKKFIIQLNLCESFFCWISLKLPNFKFIYFSCG